MSVAKNEGPRVVIYALPGAFSLDVVLIDAHEVGSQAS